MLLFLPAYHGILLLRHSSSMMYLQQKNHKCIRKNYNIHNLNIYYSGIHSCSNSCTLNMNYKLNIVKYYMKPYYYIHYIYNNVLMYSVSYKNHLMNISNSCYMLSNMRCMYLLCLYSYYIYNHTLLPNVHTTFDLPLSSQPLMA